MIRGVAVEKLASEKSAKIKTRQEAPQTIFSSRLDIFYPSIFAYFEKKGLFQQPQDFSTPIRARAKSSGESGLDVLADYDLDWFLLPRVLFYFRVTRKTIRLFRARPSWVELPATG